MAILLTSQPYRRSWTKNSMCFKFETTFGSEGMPANYRIEYELLMEKNYMQNDWEVVSSHRSEPDSNGMLLFDVSELMEDAILNTFPEPPVPEFNGDFAYVSTAFRRFKVLWAERFGQPPETLQFEESDIFYAFLGGISDELFAKGDYFEGIDAGNSFLSWWPNRKLLGKTQPDYISWFNYTEQPQSVNLRVEVFKDGQKVIEEIVTRHNVLIVDEDFVVVFPVGPEQMDLNNLGYDVSMYTVQVINGSGVPLSPKRTYIVDQMYNEVEHNLLYFNGFFQPQVVRCRGQKRTDLIVTKEFTSRIRRCQPNVLLGTVFQSSSDFDQEFRFRTGYLKKEEIEALQELMIYNNVFEITAEGYRPLLVTNGRFSTGNELDILRSEEIQAVGSLKKKAYSEDTSNRIPTEVCTANNWLTDDENCWTTLLNQFWEEP